MPGLVLQPIDQAAKKALAQQLACWAKTPNGMTDRSVQYGTCCVSPTGQTLGRWTIPPGLCDTYGELPFTSQGEPIVCDPNQTQFIPYYIYPEDVVPVDPNTCAGPTEALEAPEDLTAGTPTTSTIPLTWSAVDNATGYLVQFSANGGTSWASVSASGTDLTLSGLMADTEYTIRVAALDATGAYLRSEYSTEITATTEQDVAPLPVPLNVATGTVSDTEVELSWDAVTGADGYIVEWSPAGADTWTPVTSATTSATITGLEAETTYDIRVAATDSTDAMGQSDWSPIVQATTTA